MRVSFCNCLLTGTHDFTYTRDVNTWIIKMAQVRPSRTFPPNENFQDVLESLPFGVLVANSRGDPIYVNPETVRILGPMGSTAPTDWTCACGIYQSDKITPYRPEDFPLQRAVRGEIVRDALMFVRNSSNPSGLWVRSRALPLSHMRGGQGVVATFYDVTEARNAVEKNRLLSQAVEQTADCIVITDPFGTIEYVNPAFEITTGYAAREAIGNNPRMLKSGVHDDGFYSKLWRSLLAGEPYRGTLINKRKNGEFFAAEETITPIKNEWGIVTHFVSLLKDLTESKKQHEREVQMRIARQVQQRFYTRTVPIDGVDVGTAIIPAEETGGDYCDFIPNRDGSVTIAVGDVSGHGIGSALVGTLLRAYVRAFSAQGLGINENMIETNRMLLADLEPARYATLFLARLGHGGKSMEYSSAGHVPGFVLAHDGEVTYWLKSCGLMLGVFPEVEMPKLRVPLGAGDTVVLLTDGVTEQACEDGEELGIDRVVQLVRILREAPAQQIANGICARALNAVAGASQTDDVTVVVLKVAA